MLPKHWKIKKLRSIAYMKGRIGWQNLRASEFTTEGPYLITGMNFKNGKIDWKEVYHITEERYNEAPEIQLQVGDVLMTKDGTIGKLLYVDYLPDKASLNSHLLLFRPLGRDFLPKFLYYQLNSDLFQHHIELTKTGTTFFGITQEAAGEYKMFLPTIDEQVSIIHHLDKKIEQIDFCIDGKRNLIDLLNEEKAAIINNAVTKGIDETALMRLSGIEWLGDIPAHWQVKKIKHLTKISGRIGFRGYTNEDIVEAGEGAISLSPGNIKDNHLTLQQTTYISWEKYHESPEIKVEEGDVIFVKTGSTIGKIALISQLIEPMTINPQLVIFKELSINNQFFYYFMQTKFIKSSLALNIFGGATPAINQETLNSLYVLVPSAEEQLKIVEHIQGTTRKIDNAVAKIEKEIELLTEYKTSLIYEVVTGKVKVDTLVEEPSEAQLAS
jgi:type I restriction enzyme S subunit